jgi:hypothetical protein
MDAARMRWSKLGICTLTSRPGLTCGSILALISEHHAYVGQTTAAQFTGPIRTGEGLRL